MGSSNRGRICLASSLLLGHGKTYPRHEKKGFSFRGFNRRSGYLLDKIRIFLLKLSRDFKGIDGLVYG